MADKKEITPEMARSHIDGNGTVCPFCGDGDLFGEEFSDDGGVVTQYLECSSCNGKWIDVYLLVGICDADGNRIEPTLEPKKIYIEVSGGLVNGVWGSAGLEAVIIDHDNAECDEDTESSNKELMADLETAKANGEVVELDQN